MAKKRERRALGRGFSLNKQTGKIAPKKINTGLPVKKT
jgi:hypothetical protein